MAAKDPAVRSISSRVAAIERHHPGTDTTALRRDLRVAQATAYLRGLGDLPLEQRAQLARTVLAPSGDAA
jgi:hypothetical protein